MRVLLDLKMIFVRGKARGTSEPLDLEALVNLRTVYP
jgi:hypothetical protein